MANAVGGVVPVVDKTMRPGLPRVLRQIEKAFEATRITDAATQSLVDFALYQLRIACQDENSRLQQEWFDKLTKIAKEVGTGPNDTRMHRAKALVAYRRNRHHRKGYGQGVNAD